MFAKLKTLPVIGFFVRYPAILAFVIFAVWITLRDDVFRQYGTIIYFPEGFLGAVVLAVVGAHLLFGHSSDKDVADGKFTTWWHAELTPKEKVDRRLLILAVLFIGACICFHAIAK